jgi:hypothetical protein
MGFCVTIVFMSKTIKNRIPVLQPGTLFPQKMSYSSSAVPNTTRLQVNDHGSYTAVPYIIAA